MLNTLSTSEREQLSRAVALSVCALAGFFCVWLLVRMVWLLLPRADTDFAVTTITTPVVTAGDAAGSVAKWHLFGNPQTAANRTQLAGNAPATTLKLSLHGTLALPDPKAGIAMIADDQGVERAYDVGEEVAGGAKLVEVYTNRVILSHEGAIETLPLPKPEDHGVSNPTNAVPATAAKGKPGIVVPAYTPPVMANGTVNWTDVQQKLQVHPEELARQMHVEQVMENGKFTGVRLSGGANAALLSQLGLKPTDVVTAVNGTPLAGLSNTQQLLDNLKNSSQLQVTVQRDGQPATLTVNLK